MEENKGNLFQNLSKFLFKKNSQQPPLDLTPTTESTKFLDLHKLAQNVK